VKNGNRKWIPLCVVLGAAAAGVLLATFPPVHKELRTPRLICFGSLSTKTAALLGDPGGDGGGGRVTATEWERRGKGDYAVFQACHMERAATDDSPRVVSALVIQDSQGPPLVLGGPVRLGAGLDGWVRPGRAEAALPAGCARRMGSTAPYVTVQVDVASWDEETMKPAQRAAANRANQAVLREAVTKLTTLYACGT
jgi:hypothetical protein